MEFPIIIYQCPTITNLPIFWPISSEKHPLSPLKCKKHGSLNATNYGTSLHRKSLSECNRHLGPLITFNFLIVGLIEMLSYFDKDAQSHPLMSNARLNLVLSFWQLVA